MTQALPNDVPQTLRRWKRYPAYKDSGVEWLGEIPEYWEVKKIKRFCLVKRGASPRPIDNPIYFDDEGEYSWVRISDVTASKKYLLTTEQRLSENGKSKSVPLEPGELFLSIAASVGKPIITAIKCCIHDGFVYFVGLKYNREYLFYIFLSGELYKGLGKLGTQLNLNTDTIGDIQVPVPLEADQQAIASFLDRETAKIDALIARKERLIELLQEKRTAIISHAVTKGLDPTVQMKDSGVEWLGEIPKHWKVRRNKALFRLFNGYAFKGEYFSNEEQDVPILITPGNFNPDGGLYFTQDNTTYYTGDYPSEFCLKLGEQLIVMTDLSYKKLILGQSVTVDREGLLLNQRVAKIILHKKIAEQIYLPFLSYALNSKCVREQVISTARGSTVFHSSPEKIGESLMAMPPLAEQKKIREYLDRETAKIDALIAKIREGIEKLKEYRTAIISAAVTGKIDVRNEVAS